MKTTISRKHFSMSMLFNDAIQIFFEDVYPYLNPEYFNHDHNAELKKILLNDVNSEENFYNISGYQYLKR